MNNQNVIIYTELFLKSMLEASKAAQIDPRKQTNCCSEIGGVCSQLGDLPRGFYFNLKSKYGLVILMIRLYDAILANCNTKANRCLLEYFHFVIGLSADWEILAAYLDKTVLTTACVKGQPWRDASILGNGPIPNFSAITSAYGDVFLSYFTYLFRDRLALSFVLGQLQQAYVQISTECVRQSRYWDSPNFNPRKPFSFTSCINLTGLSDLPKNVPLNNLYTPSLQNFLPQMVWHMFSIDFNNFLINTRNSETKFGKLNPSYQKIINRGKDIIKDRNFIKKTCLEMIIRLEQESVKLFGQPIAPALGTGDGGGFPPNALKLISSRPLFQPSDDILFLLINFILEFLKDSPSGRVFDNPIIKTKLFKILESDITNQQKKLQIIKDAENIAVETIQALNKNAISPDLLKNICYFYNKTCGLNKINRELRGVPFLSDLRCAA